MARYRPKWERLREWHRWFAWYPVKIAPDRRAWLIWVERRLSELGGQYKQPDPLQWSREARWYEYRLPSQRA